MHPGKKTEKGAGHILPLRRGLVVLFLAFDDGGQLVDVEVLLGMDPVPFLLTLEDTVDAGVEFGLDVVHDGVPEFGPLHGGFNLSLDAVQEVLDFLPLFYGDVHLVDN